MLTYYQSSHLDTCYNLLSCCWEWADRTALSGIAVQHADDGYFRRRNFGGSLIAHSVLLMYSQDSTNVYRSFKRWGGEFAGSGGWRWLKVVKLCS